MGKEENWYMIMFLLYDFEIYTFFEDFVIKNELAKSKKDVTKMDFDDFAICVELFLEDFKIAENQKNELLKYCSKQ